MNWKEQVEKSRWFNCCDSHKNSPIEFIETEIIEKLIEDVAQELDSPPITIARFKQQLRAKWLGKD